MTNPLDNLANSPFDIAQQAALEIANWTGKQHYDIAITLGSGWGKAADILGNITHTIPATDITGFNASKVAGHTGTLRSVELESGKRALIIGARTHYYEGHGVRHVVHSVRTAAALGCTTMILTNGAGGINPNWKPGTPVIIKDHINFTAASPLEGATFIDLTDLYTPALRDIARTVDPTLDEGVYCMLPGSHYETPAEIFMLKTVGGDIAGMSTALEAIAAREAGMDILGMSLITNLAAGISPTPLNHQEVLDAGKEAEPKLAKLLSAIINKI